MKGGKTCANLIQNNASSTHQKLDQVLKYGLKLKNVSRFIRFKQSYWMQIYIILNTTLRTDEKMNLKKIFLKLMNNSIFGKTIKNIRKLKDITP